MPEPLIDLLYVSRSRLGLHEADRIADIVAVSTPRNIALGVSGALIWTGTAFAQILEGPPAAIETLMASITRDARHEQVRVICSGAITSRGFEDWALAYAGGASFVSNLIEPLMGRVPPAPHDPAVRKLIHAMRAFADGGET